MTSGVPSRDDRETEQTVRWAIDITDPAHRIGIGPQSLSAAEMIQAAEEAEQLRRRERQIAAASGWNSSTTTIRMIRDGLRAGGER
jgi:hypothetical protein